MYYDSELYHFGVAGMHWGIRRYQYPDGSYKPGAEGRYYSYEPVTGRRYHKNLVTSIRSRSRDISKKYRNERVEAELQRKRQESKLKREELKSVLKKIESEANSDRKKKNKTAYDTSYDEQKTIDERNAKLKKYAMAGAAVVAAAVAAYGIYKLRSLKAESVMEYKRNVDIVLERGTMLNTLSYDPNRTKGADMFFATHTKLDNHQYNALFNKPIKEYVKDSKGNIIGSVMNNKFRIKNKLLKNMKIASERSAAKEFTNLIENDADFKRFVFDSGGMEDHFVVSKYKFKGYREAKRVLDKLREPGYQPSKDDYQTIYRMFNYVIPSDGTKEGLSPEAIKIRADDVKRQREKFFAAMKKAGYGGVLDTNDSMYGGFKATSPVIIFDQDAIVYMGAKRTTNMSKIPSAWILAGRRLLGI